MIVYLTCVCCLVHLSNPSGLSLGDSEVSVMQAPATPQAAHAVLDTPVFPPHPPKTYTEEEIKMREEIAYLRGMVESKGKGSSSSSGMWYAR